VRLPSIPRRERDPRTLVGADLALPVADDLANMGRKTLACFEYMLEHRPFELVFRPNSSSYVDLPNLRAFVDAHARPERFYCGFPGRHDSVPFASGSGYFLSRDLLELAVRERVRWDRSVHDDVALGKLMQMHGVEVVPLERVDYATSAGVDVDDIDTSQLHFRCKTASPWRVGDVRLMLTVHRAFCRARGRSFRSPLVPVLDVLGKLHVGWRRARGIG